MDKTSEHLIEFWKHDDYRVYVIQQMALYYAEMQTAAKTAEILRINIRDVHEIAKMFDGLFERSTTSAPRYYVNQDYDTFEVRDSKVPGFKYFTIATYKQRPDFDAKEEAERLCERLNREC